MIVEVKVLRHNDSFNVCCQQDTTIAELKRFCIKFSKVPIQECSIICQGIKISEDNLLVRNTQIAQSKKIFIFVVALLDKVENEMAEATKLMRGGINIMEPNEKTLKLVSLLMSKGIGFKGIPAKFRKYIESFHVREDDDDSVEYEEYYY